MNEDVRFSFSEIERMAEAVVKSGMFEIDNVNVVVALLLIAQSNGLHPMCGFQHLRKDRGLIPYEKLEKKEEQEEQDNLTQWLYKRTIDKGWYLTRETYATAGKAKAAVGLMDAEYKRFTQED